MKRLFVAAVLAALCAAPVLAQKAAGKADGMKILSGEAKVTQPDGTVVTLKAGDTIPSGSKVEVVAGEATFQSGTAVVKADAGDSFSFAATGGNPQITATNGSLTVTVGNTTATLDKGDGISVQGVGGQKAEIKVTSGEVAVQSDGKTETLAAGKTATAETPPQTVPVTQAEQTGGEAPPPTETTTAQTTTSAPNPSQETQTVSPSSP